MPKALQRCLAAILYNFLSYYAHQKQSWDNCLLHHTGVVPGGAGHLSEHCLAGAQLARCGAVSAWYYFLQPDYRWAGSVHNFSRPRDPQKRAAGQLSELSNARTEDADHFDPPLSADFGAPHAERRSAPRLLPSHAG